MEADCEFTNDAVRGEATESELTGNNLEDSC